MNHQRSRKTLILGSSFGTLIILCAAFAPVLGETETTEGFFAQLWDSIFGSKPSVQSSNETVVKNDTVSEPSLKTTELPPRPTGDNETITDSTAAPTLSSTVPQGTTDRQDGSSTTTTPRSQTDKEDSTSSPTTLSTAAASSMTTDKATSATTIANSSDSVENATTISTTNEPIATTSAPSPNKTS